MIYNSVLYTAHKEDETTCEKKITFLNILDRHKKLMSSSLPPLTSRYSTIGDPKLVNRKNPTMHFNLLYHINAIPIQRFQKERLTY
jgi:hypothetical protein